MRAVVTFVELGPSSKSPSRASRRVSRLTTYKVQKNSQRQTKLLSSTFPACSCSLVSTAVSKPASRLGLHFRSFPFFQPLLHPSLSPTQPAMSKRKSDDSSTDSNVKRPALAPLFAPRATNKPLPRLPNNPLALPKTNEGELKVATWNVCGLESSMSVAKKVGCSACVVPAMVS